MAQPAPPSTNKDNVLNAFLWFWVTAGTVAYVFQLRDFIGPILDLLGLS